MKELDKSKFWIIRDNPIIKTGVFPYLGRQISPDLNPTQIYNVLRPEDELFNEKTIESFNMLPITIGHALLGSKDEGLTPPEEKGIEGTTGEHAKRTGDKMTNTIKLYSERIKDEINNGKKELSAGYFCDFMPESGTYQGRHYDYVQRNIDGNHIALVEKGRNGSDVRVMDSAEGLNPSRQFVCDAMELGKIEEQGENMNGVAKDAEFDESKHKRDSDGKFTSGGSSGNARRQDHGFYGGEKAKKEDPKLGDELNKYAVKLENAGADPKEIHRLNREGNIAGMKKLLQKTESKSSENKTDNKPSASNKKESMEKAYAEFRQYQNSEQGRKERIDMENGKLGIGPVGYYKKKTEEFAKKHGLDPEEFRDFHFDKITAEGERRQQQKQNKYKHMMNRVFGNSSTNHGNSGQDAATEKEKKHMDKREVIREIMALAAKPAEQFEGGEEEKVEAIAKLVEKIAYNPSESGANDAEEADPKEEELKEEFEAKESEDKASGCDKDEEDKEDEEDKKLASLDEMEKELLARIGRKAELVNKLTPIIGAFDSASMTEKEVAAYACKKLNIKAALDEAPAVLKGYLAGYKPAVKRVTMKSAQDEAVNYDVLKDFKENK